MTCPTIVVAGRVLAPTAVFDTYWRFAAARQAIYLARLRGVGEPWSDDPILRDYRFTNVYRAADRVSQFLIQNIIYNSDAPDDPENVVFRVLLFKLLTEFRRGARWRGSWALLNGELLTSPVTLRHWIKPPRTARSIRRHT